MGRRIRNAGVVYAGEVGAPMRPRRQRSPAKGPVHHMPVRCLGGPYNGRVLRRNTETPGTTLPFIVGGWPPGHYDVAGNWHTA